MLHICFASIYFGCCFIAYLYYVGHTPGTTLYFVLVSASGGFEAAPILGYADMIADITVTGTTIRDNDLKILKDGIVFESQASLIGKKTLIPEGLIDSQDLKKIINVYIVFVLH